MRSARRAVALAFFLNGFAFSSWAARIPDTRHALGLSDPQLGLLLLAMSTGSILALPLSGALVHRLGVTAVIRAGVVGVAGALLGFGFTIGAGSVLCTAALMFLYGISTSVWDVAMNVEGAEVEHRLGRSIMPRFHAAFSLGTVAGALLGAAAAHLSESLLPHLPWVGLVVICAGLAGSRAFLTPTTEDATPTGSGSRAAWGERRTLMIGVVVLAMALAEGSANDWLAVALRDGYGVTRPVAVLGFALFVTAMTLARLLGPVLLDGYGRVRVLYATMGLAAAGILLVVFGQQPWFVIPGIVMWGAGASLAFPVGMSASSDDPSRAAARVAVVSTWGYTAFLAGPPLLGFVAGEVGTLRSLLVVGLLLVPALLLVPSVRRPEPTTHRPAPDSHGGQG